MCKRVEPIAGVCSHAPAPGRGRGSGRESFLTPVTKEDVTRGFWSMDGETH